MGGSPRNQRSDESDGDGTVVPESSRPATAADRSGETMRQSAAPPPLATSRVGGSTAAHLVRSVLLLYTWKVGVG